ncbi:hypothetical protein EMCRGX_G003015 [Ephydatia muelleri]
MERAGWMHLQNNSPKETILGVALRFVYKFQLLPPKWRADLAVQMILRPYVSNASVVVLIGQLATANAILEAVARRRLLDQTFSKRNLTWLASDAWGDQLSQYHSSIATNIIAAIPKYNASKGFDDYFQSLTPQNNAQNPWFTEYWEHTFNCSFNNVSTQSALSPRCNMSQKIGPASGYRQNSKVSFTIDAVYAIAHAIDNLQRDECSGDDICDKIVIHSNGRTSINNELLKRYLQSVNFSGESAAVIRFNQNGDQQGSYFIKALKVINGQYFFEIIGLWDSSTYILLFEKTPTWSLMEEAPRSICSEKCKAAGERSEILTECRTSPTLGISDHLSGAYGPQLQRLLHQPGDTIRSRWQGVEVMMVRSSAAGGHDDRGRIPHPDDYGV